MSHPWPSLVAALTLALTPLSPYAAPPATGSGTPLDLNLPSLGTVSGADLSPSEERALGEQIMQSVRADPTYLSDPELTEYLNRLGYQLVSHTKSSTYTFDFFAIRDATLNAFALPGGFVAVHTGTIVAAKSESELAGVMGHEIGHVTQRHIARMIEGQKGNLAVTLGSLLLAILAARAGGNSGGQAAAAIAMGSQAALIQSQLNYSQNAEREADRIGLQTLAASGFDPRGMENFFKRLQANNRFYESAAPAYLSTHPLTTERLIDMENRTQQMKSHMHADSADFLLMQQRARVLQATGTEERLQLLKTMGAEYKAAQGRRKAVLAYGLYSLEDALGHRKTALEYAREAERLFPDNASVQRAVLRSGFDNADTTAAKEAVLKQAEAAARHFPLSSMMTENVVDMLYSLGRHAELIKLLRSGDTALKDDTPDYHALLARSYAALGQKSLQFRHTGEMYALLGQTQAAVYQYDLAQRANDGDFYTMSEIDARLRDLRAKLLDEQAKRNSR